MQALERGQPPHGEVTVVDKPERILEMQQLSSAHSLTKKITLIAKKDRDSTFKAPGCKSLLLPWMGNLALVDAWVATSVGEEPGLSGEKPEEVQAKDDLGISFDDRLTLRVTAVLTFLENKVQERILAKPELCLKLLGCTLSEVRTSNWQAILGTVVGYMVIHKKHLDEILKLSGQHGVFVKRLSKDVIEQPAVSWVVRDEKESDKDYFVRARKMADEKGVPMSFRQGGGNSLGLQTKGDSVQARAWNIFGLPTTWGPTTVAEWMTERGWKIQGGVRPPLNGRRPWFMHAVHEQKPELTSFAYQFPYGNGNVRNISVRPYQKIRKAEAEPQRLVSNAWFGKDAPDPLNDPIEDDNVEVQNKGTSPTIPFSLQVAETALDSTCDSQDPNGENSKSPPKKKSKMSVSETKFQIANGCRGPDGFQLADLGGSGNCAWRALAWMISKQNGKWKNIGDVKDLEVKAKTLKAKANNFLLVSCTSWKDTWVPDPKATSVTEDGPVPTCLAEFEKSLTRPMRWACGLQLAAAAQVQKCNIVIWKFLEENWVRVALLTGGHNYQKMPTIPIVLHKDHYFAISRTADKPFPAEWGLDSEDLECFICGASDEIFSQNDNHNVNNVFRGGGKNSSLTTSSKKANKTVKDMNLVKENQRSNGSLGNAEEATPEAEALAFSTPKRMTKKCWSDDECDSMRTCSAVLSSLRACSSVKTVEKNKKFWQCPVCELLVHVDGKPSRFYEHLYKLHKPQVLAAQEQQKRFGRSGRKTALGPGKIWQPTEFIHIPEERRDAEAGFICPYCDKCLPIWVKHGSHVRISKKAHLRHGCSRKFRKPQLYKYWLAYLKKFGAWRKVMATRKLTMTQKALDSAVSRGHDPVVFDFAWAGWKVRPGTQMYMCKRSWLNKCHGDRELSKPSLEWWKRAAKENDIDAIANKIGMGKRELSSIKQKIANDEQEWLPLQQMFRGGSECQTEFTDARFWTVNVGGYEGLWRLINLVQTWKINDRPEVICVQEASCSTDQFASVRNFVDKLGYHCFGCGFQEMKAHRFRRGVLTLVRSCLNVQWLGEKVQRDGQLLALNIGNLLCVNSYNIPGAESCMQQISSLDELLASLSWHGRFVFCGDWNQEFLGSWVATLAVQIGGSAVSLCNSTSTRWKGNKIIDYFVTNAENAISEARDEYVSDHKIIESHFAIDATRGAEFRFTKKVSFSKPAWLSHCAWTQNLEEAWSFGEMQNWQDVYLALQASGHDVGSWDCLTDQEFVDFEWLVTSYKLSWCFREAALISLFQIPLDFVKFDEIKRVESLANHLHTPASIVLQERHFPHFPRLENLASRKLRTKLGRCLELKRRMERSQFDAETRKLMSKVGKFFPYGDVALPSLILFIENLEKEIKHADEQAKLNGLDAWKGRTTNGLHHKALWLKRKHCPQPPAVGRPESCTQNKQDAAEKLFRFWSSLQDRVRWEPAERNRATQNLAASLAPHFVDVGLEEGRPSVDEFRDALKRSKGCAGIDGWTAAEAVAIAGSHSLSGALWKCMQTWEDCACTPTWLQHLRLACLPKEHKVINNTLETHCWRPLSILPIFWRAWSSCWLHSKWVSSWTASLFPRNMSGGLPHSLGPECMAGILDAALQKYKFGVSLDFKHAFDCVDLGLMKGTFEEVLPAPCKIWSRLLLFQWQNSSRWVGYGGCLYSAPFKSSCGIPQGDPCSPLVLAVLLRAGYEQVCQAIGEQNMMMCIYMDDRTVIADSKERVELAKTAWSDFAKQFHLLENDSKAQLVDVSGGVLSGEYRNWFEVLGACLGCPSLEDFNKFHRFAKRKSQALHMARRIGLLPESLCAKIDDLHVFCGPMMNYGWIHGFPEETFSHSYNTGLWKAVGRFHYSFRDLRAIVGGASLHLQPSVLWKQIRLIAHCAKELSGFGFDVSEWKFMEVVCGQLGVLGWFFQNGKWMHEHFNEVWNFEDVLGPRWPRIAHVLRESWREYSFNCLAFSGRHELVNEDIGCYDVDRIELVRKWARTSSTAYLLSVGAIESPKVRALGVNGKILKCPTCGCDSPFWDHLWSCCLKQDPPADVLLRRFLWPRCGLDIPLCQKFVEVVQSLERWDGGVCVAHYGEYHSTKVR